MPFYEFYKSLLDGKELLAFGKLTSFLLAADYACSGFIQTPDCSTVGKLIFEIDSGGKAGLKILGYTCADRAQTSWAFSQVYQALNNFLSPEEKEKMNFGVFLGENSLCKLSRLNDKPVFKAVCKKWGVQRP